MIRSIALIFAVLAISTSCGKVEDKEDKDNIPDPGLKKLSNIQKRKVSDVIGAMGDLSFVVADMAGANFSEERAGVDRKALRTRLMKSLDIQNPNSKCSLEKSGGSYHKNYKMKASGLHCRFILDYDTRTSATKTNKKDDFTNRTEFRREFKGEDRHVDTDLFRSSTQGDYRFKRTTSKQGVRYERNSNVKMRVTSRKMGVFNYVLEEKFTQLVEAETNNTRQQYRRVDRFEFRNKFKVTVFKSIENLQSNKETKAYTVNGENLTADEYTLFMQDMEKQIGMERFKDLTSPSQM